jgi:hypothetical protein
VVVAVITMRIVQMPGDMIIDMIAVRHRLVAATGPMHVVRFMTAAAMIRRAAVGIAAGYADHVLVDVVLMRVV